jgi:hypothetical protein
MAERLDGVRLADDEVALVAALVRAGVAAIESRNGSVPPAALWVRDRLAMFARRTSYAQARAPGEHANMAVASSPPPSAARVTVAEAAARTGYSPQHIRRLCDSGALTAARSAAGAWEIEAWSLEKLAARQGNRMRDDRQAG